MKLGVALAHPVQSRFDPHHGLDAEADLFPFVRAKPLNQLVGALETAELESEVLQVMGDITTRCPLSRLPQVYPPQRLFGWRLGEPRLRYTDVLYGWPRR
jgi:DDE family transposase